MYEGTVTDSKFFTLKSNSGNFERVIYHCPDCYNLPHIKINEDLITANMSCDKNHQYNNIPLPELKNKLDISSITVESIKANKNIICFKCNKNIQIDESQNDLEKILEGYGYCFGCNNLICSNCIKSHDENEKKKDHSAHKLIPLSKYINYCPIHRNRYSAYCFDCKKNTCLKCTEHKQHKKYHFDDYLLLEEDVKKYKQQILEKKIYCENMENQINSILNKIKENFHEEMQKYLNILNMDEFLLDAYQTNQVNYIYLQNILNNFSNLEFIAKKTDVQDTKQILKELIEKLDLSFLENEQNINKTKGELLQVSQQNKINEQSKTNVDTKETKTSFQVEENNKSLKNIENNLELTSDSKNNKFEQSKKSVKNEDNQIFGEKLSNSLKNVTKNDKINIEENKIYSKSMKTNSKLSCEFVGNNSETNNYSLNKLPNNIEINLEIKNNGENPLPKGCYLYDENNCRALMILDNYLNGIEPGKTITKKLKLDLYVYNKGSYHGKLSIKDPNGNYISSNKFEYNLNIE